MRCRRGGKHIDREFQKSQKHFLYAFYVLLRTRTHIHTDAIVSYIEHSVKSLNLNLVSRSSFGLFGSVSVIFWGKSVEKIASGKNEHRHGRLETI